MINDTLNKLRNIVTGIRTSDDQIEQAEKELGLKFAPEYIRYVKRFGVFSASSIELTGITDIDRLNVVSATKRERKLNSKIPNDMYVIENLAIDGFVVLQDAFGIIYYISPCYKPKKMFESLEEYVEITRVQKM
mgnify:CR=1 FL=1